MHVHVRRENDEANETRIVGAWQSARRGCGGGHHGPPRGWRIPTCWRAQGQRHVATMSTEESAFMRKARSHRSVLVCALVVTVHACARSPQPADQGSQQSFVYDERVGLAKWYENLGCLAVFNPSIAPRTEVALVDQPASAELPSVRAASVVDRLPQACDEGLSGTNNHGATPSFYRIAIADGTMPPVGVVFAILEPSRPVAVRDGQVEADLDGDGAVESFRVCASTEHLHFMVWTGSPGQGRPRWHDTYYVGYDMVPSCTEQDVSGMGVS